MKTKMWSRRGRMSWTLPSITALVLAVGMVVTLPSQAASSDSRADYVEAIEQVCQRDKPRSERMIRQANRLFKARRYAPAARTLTRAGNVFDRTLNRMKKVAPPPNDRRTVGRWLNQLTAQSKILRQIATALRRENRRLVERLQTRVLHSSNRANNTVFLFEFRHCHIVPGAYL